LRRRQGLAGRAASGPPCGVEPPPEPGKDLVGGGGLVAVEPCWAQEQPRETAAEPAWMVRRVDGARMELQHDGAEDAFQGGAQPLGEIELGAGARLGDLAVPVGAETTGDGGW